MCQKNIRDYVRYELSEKEQLIALAFVDYLEENQMEFMKKMVDIRMKEIEEILGD